MDELNVANNEVVSNQIKENEHDTVNSSYSEWDVSKGSSYIGNDVTIESYDGDQTIDPNNGNLTITNDGIDDDSNIDEWGDGVDVVYPIGVTNYNTNESKNVSNNGLTNGNKDVEVINDSWGNPVNSNKKYNRHTYTALKKTQHNGAFKNGYHNNGYNNEASHNSWGNEIESNSYGSDRNRGYQSRQGQGIRRSFDRKPNNFGNNEEDGNHGSEKPALPKPTYIPPDFEETDDFIVEVGSTFGKYDEIEVKVSGMDVPKNITSFQNAGLREVLLSNLAKCHHITPTPIQKYALPIIMSGRDMIASAQTGSGKTAAFILPILNNLLSDPSELIVDHNHCEPQVLIMSPTRELAIQICEVATRLSRGTNIKCELLYGGTATYHQKAKILKGVHIIVGTMGRLTDFANRGFITFSSLRYVVLDEADRMLDMGFQLDVERILSLGTMVSPAERTTVMFSATLPEDVQHIAKSYLKPDYISVGVGEVGGACKDVTQQIVLVNKFNKKKELMNMLKTLDDCQGTIVFVEQKRQADFIAAFLSEMDFPTTSIHGDREQPERELALRDFKTKKMKILVATSVAARGLDILGVKMVINYDLPKTIEEYVHRIGRTGRLGNSGQAVSFYDPEQDAHIAPYLVDTLKKAEQEIPEFLSTHSNGEHIPSQDQFNDIRTDVTVTSEYLVDEDW